MSDHDQFVFQNHRHRRRCCCYFSLNFMNESNEWLHIVSVIIMFTGR